VTPRPNDPPSHPANRAASVHSSLGRSPIGIFDSGVGGISVLRELYQQLPQESFLYFGDTARLPYGSRSPEEIERYVREILLWMQDQGVKMVIMACNTSSALALEAVRRDYDLPILGLILPTARVAVRQGRRIGVIATSATVDSGAYQQAIQELDSTAQVWAMGCPEFVPLVEANRIYDPYTRQVAAEYLEPLLHQHIDTLIYGCTHYPHLSPVIRSLLPAHVQLINPAESVSQAAVRELALLGLSSTTPPQPTRFGVSGNPHKFREAARPWLGFNPSVEAIDLPKLDPV
jgi:glutamate racemase